MSHLATEILGSIVVVNWGILVEKYLPVLHCSATKTQYDINQRCITKTHVSKEVQKKFECYHGKVQNNLLGSWRFSTTPEKKEIRVRILSFQFFNYLSLKHSIQPPYQFRFLKKNPRGIRDLPIQEIQTTSFIGMHRSIPEAYI